MQGTQSTVCTAFDGARLIASGLLPEVAVRIQQLRSEDNLASPVVFDDVTGRPIELDLRGTADDVLRRIPPAPEPVTTDAPPGEPARGPGRPKLGVVGREVTLLPRHWEWLDRQPGGASVTLRKLVETARRDSSGDEREREATEAVYRVMSTLAGDLAGFEEASRALFSKELDRLKRLEDQIVAWPADIRQYVLRLATRS